MPDMSPLGVVLFTAIGAFLGLIAGVLSGLVSMVVGGLFFAPAFICTIVGGFAGYIYGAYMA